MNESASLEIPGVPIPAARPRVTRFRGTFDPKAKEKRAAQKIISTQWSTEPLECPLRLEVTFHMPKPKSWSMKRKKNLEGGPHISKPDTDNLLKFAMDSMSEIVFTDDSLIYSLRATKTYSDNPKTLIRISKSEYEVKYGTT